MLTRRTMAMAGTGSASTRRLIADERGGNHRQLGVEERIGQRLGLIGDQQQDAGRGIQPEVAPCDGKKAAERRDRDVRGDAQQAQVQRDVQPGHESQADGVQGEDERECEQRRGLDNPDAQRTRLDPRKERIEHGGSIPRPVASAGGYLDIPNFTPNT